MPSGSGADPTTQPWVSLTGRPPIGRTPLGCQDGGSDGWGIGGGLYIADGSLVYLDAYTVAHVTNNKASTAAPNIDGWYTVVS